MSTHLNIWSVSKSIFRRKILSVLKRKAVTGFQGQILCTKLTSPRNYANVKTLKNINANRMACNNKECFNMLPFITEYSEEQRNKKISNEEAWEILNQVTEGIHGRSLSDLIDDAIEELQRIKRN